MDLIDRAAAIEAMKNWATQPVIMKSRGWDKAGKAITLDLLATVEEQPTIPAVPLEPLCEWLSDHAGRPMDCVGKLCGKCEFDGVGAGQEKCWENLIRKWREAQHEQQTV